MQIDTIPEQSICRMNNLSDVNECSLNMQINIELTESSGFG